MAESGAQEQTLANVLDQLKVANDLTVGMKVDLSHVQTEVKKQRSDAGKHHNWQKKDSKKDDKDQKEQSKIFQAMHGILLAGKKLQEKAAKLAKLAGGKIKDFAGKQIDGIKKAAGNLMDLLKKGLGLALLWGLFKLIQTIDIEGLIEGAKSVYDAVLSVKDGLLGIAGWMAVDKIVTFFKGESPTANFVKRMKEAMKNTWMGKMVDRMKSFFAVDGKDAKELTKWQKRLVKVQQWFKESWLGKLIDKIKLFFGQKGQGGKGLTKVTGWFKTIGDFFKNSKVITKVSGFIKTLGKVLGKIFLPVTIVMALWDAVSGFMTGFEDTEGNMFQKILGGIGGAVKGLLDFFVFGIAEMVQDVIVWLLSLFGFDDAAVAVGDFNLVGKIKDAVFGAIDFITELFSFRDTSLKGIFKSLIDILMLPLNLAINFVKDLFGFGDPEKPFKFSEWIFEMFDKVWKWITEELLVNPVDALTNLVKGLLGGYVGFLDWILAMIKKPVTWLLEMFGWDDAAGAVEKFTLMGFLTESWNKVKAWLTGILSWASEEDENDSIIVKYVKKAINGIKDWFGKMFDFGSAEGILKSVINVLTWFPNIIKDAITAVTSWLLGLFGFDDAAKKVADTSKFSIGDMVMNVLKKIGEFISGLFDFDFSGIAKSVIDTLPGFVTAMIPDSWLAKMTGVKESAMGGPIGKGIPTLVGEHGPEMFVPSASGRILPRMQTENAMGGGGGAPMIISAPTSNVSNGSATMSIASSSINPMNEKYFRN